MVAKLTRLTYKIEVQVHLMVEICTIFSSRSRRKVRKLLDTPSHVQERDLCHLTFLADPPLYVLL